MLVPKLVLDEKSDQLMLFINPFLEKSSEFLKEKIADIEDFWPKNRIQANLGAAFQQPKTTCEILSHGGKMVSVATDWRGECS